MSYLAQNKGVQPIIVPSLGRKISLLNDLGTVWRLYRLMRRYRPDIVHTHTAKAGFVGRLAAWLARVPVRVHTFHGHVFHGYFGPFKTRLFLWLEKLSARLTSRIVTISPRLREELAYTYHIAIPGKIQVMPLGLDLEPLAEPVPEEQLTEFRAVYGLPADTSLVGIVGRLVPIKNHELFLEMARIIVEQAENVHFVIVGDGERRAALERQVRAMGLEEHVSFTGWIQDLRPLLRALNVLVLSSDNEGTPVSVIEALTVGIPVVATAVGGVPDVLEDGKWGHVVPPHNPMALATAVLRTLNGDHPDPQPCREAVLSRYGIERLVHDLNLLYRELLAALIF
jgi:glycosyltransferase involved in cell wall biosynthesis